MRDGGGDGGVVPCVAGQRAALAIGAGRHALHKGGGDGVGPPAKAERDVEDVHPQIAHASVFAVHRSHAFPVQRLGRVDVGGVEEGGFHLEDRADGTGSDEIHHALSAGVEGHFRRAADEKVGALRDGLHDGGVLGGIHAEGLFAEQVFSGGEDGGVKFGVQDVGDGAIDRIDVGVGQKLAVIGGLLAH